jgi:hypothetical protein
MFNCNVFLYCIQYINNNICLVSLSNSTFLPPHKEVSESDNYHISDYIFDLIDEYTTTNPHSINPLILDIEKKESCINIRYVCTLPIDNKLVKAHYIPYNMLCTDTLVQKAVRYV